MEKELQTKLISDLGCVTAIVCENIHPLKLTKDNLSSKIYFVFEYSPKLQEISDLYWSGKHTCSSRAFFENLKMLKNRIYELKNNG